jgi:hypothetical protein
MILKAININFDLSVFLDADYSVHKGSCISYQKREQNDLQNKLSEGFLESYHKTNTRIQRLSLSKYLHKNKLPTSNHIK